MAKETIKLKWTFVLFLALVFMLPLSAQKWERLNRRFSLHYEQSEYTKALGNALKMMEYSGEKLDSSDIRFTMSNYAVAKAYEGLGDPVSAREYIRFAYVQLAPNIAYDENMAEVARLYGKIETALGYHNAAELVLLDALEMSMELDGTESLSYLLSLYALADLKMAQAQWNEMVGILIAALQIHERNIPMDLNYTVYANYLGLLFMNSERNQEAVLYLDKCLSVYTSGQLDEDLSCANAHNNLGLIHFYQSEFEQSADHFEHAGTLFMKLTEGYSENYMMLLSNRASLYYNWGKTDRIEESYRALAEYLDRYDERMDLPYIQGVENMANFHATAGNFEESEACFLRAIEARKRMDPVDREGLNRTFQTLISVCEELNQTEKAQYYRKMSE